MCVSVGLCVMICVRLWMTVLQCIQASSTELWILLWRRSVVHDGVSLLCTSVSVCCARGCRSFVHDGVGLLCSRERVQFLIATAANISQLSLSVDYFWITIIQKFWITMNFWITMIKWSNKNVLTCTKLISNGVERPMRHIIYYMSYPIYCTHIYNPYYLLYYYLTDIFLRDIKTLKVFVN